MSNNSRKAHCVPGPVSATGFTLIEVAIALFIITLLLGSMLIPLAAQVEQRQIADTQKTMEEIRDALTGFALANGFLPCPDSRTSGVGTPNDGIEDMDAATGACLNVQADGSVTGHVPWVTLGIGNQDAWGNRLRYTVLGIYARRPPGALFALSTGGGVRVCTTAACTTTLTTTAVAVVLSHGRNGRGAINVATNAPNAAATSVDEQENSDNNDGNTVSRTQSNVAPNEFDDIVVWLPKFILNSRMVAAGKLP